jgi:hypothetical protein
VSALKFRREVDRGYSTYVAMPRDGLRYTIDQYHNVATHQDEWEVNIGPDYLATPSSHFVRDMRESRTYRYLSEARAACQRHYEDAEMAGVAS